MKKKYYSKKIVSITPIKIESDSRTFKQATSLTKLGYDSIVVEEEKSNQKIKWLFKLISINDAGNHQIFNNTQISFLKYIEEKIRKIPNFFIFPIYIISFFYKYFFKPLKLIPKAPIYYLHSFEYYFVIRYVCLKYKSKYIYDAHDFYTGIEEPKKIEKLNYFFLIPFIRWIEKKCIENSSAFITVSEGLADLYEKAYEHRPAVLLNTQDIRIKNQSKKNIKKDLNLKNNDFLIVTVGNAKKGMALKETMAAIEKLPGDIHLAFLGNNYKKILPAEYNKHKIHIVKPVKSNEVSNYIKSAQASLICYYARSKNYINCLPNGFFQAIGAKLPLLYPDLPEIKGVCKKFDLGLEINPLNIKSIVEAIIKLTNNKIIYNKFKKNLIKARKIYNWENEEKKLKKIIKKVI